MILTFKRQLYKCHRKLCTHHCNTLLDIMPKCYHSNNMFTNTTLLDYTVTVITFRVRRRRREMYCGHARLCVCVSVCLSVRGRMPTLLHGHRCNVGSGRGCPLVAHCWADLHSVHGLRCYGNITRTQNVSEYMLILALCLIILVMFITIVGVYFGLNNVQQIFSRLA